MIVSGPVGRPAASRSIVLGEPAAAAPVPDKVVEAVPRLDRSVFVYLEPREGIDGTTSFCQCASCSNFIPESFMRGAVRGDRCGLFGSNFPVDDDDSCNLYTPWADGRPCDDDVAEAADDMVSGCRGSVRPYDVGFLSDVNVRCGNCRQFDYVTKTCAFFAKLTAEQPGLFMLEPTVNIDGCCDAWSEIPPPEPLEWS